MNDCRVVDTQVSREDGGNDTVTQMILASGDLQNLEYIANVMLQYSVNFTEIFSIGKMKCFKPLYLLF